MSMKASTKLLSAAAAAATLGAMCTTAVPAHAAPCTAWKLTGNALVMNQDNGLVVMLDWPANTNRPTRGYYTAANGKRYSGPVTGGIVGGNKLDFEVRFAVEGDHDGEGFGRYENRYTGTIEEVMSGYGRARGTTVNNLGQSNSWAANESFECAVAPQQEQPKPQEPPPPPPPSPPPVEKPPTDAIRMTIARQGLTNVRVTVSNSANIPGRCTYDATEVNGLGAPVNQSFDIAGNGTRELTFLAPLLGQTYRVVVSCRGEFNGQSVEFGRQQQNFP